MKNQHLIRSIILLALPLFSTACGENDDQIAKLTKPLNCIYPGDLELDSRTLDAMSKYQQPILKDKISSDQ